MRNKLEETMNKRDMEDSMVTDALKGALQNLMKLPGGPIDQQQPQPAEMMPPEEAPQQMAQGPSDAEAQAAIDRMLAGDPAQQPAPEAAAPAAAPEEAPQQLSLRDIMSGKFRDEQIKKQLGN